MNDEALINAVTSAWREVTPDGATLGHPAWFDLTPEAREQAFDATTAQRQLEAALDPRGWNSTVRAVLSRLPQGTTRA